MLQSSILSLLWIKLIKRNTRKSCKLPMKFGMILRLKEFIFYAMLFFFKLFSYIFHSFSIVRKCRSQAHGNGRNNSMPDAPAAAVHAKFQKTTTSHGGGASSFSPPLPPSSSVSSAAVEKLSTEVVSIRVTCNSVKQECSKLRQEVASLTLIQSQMREEFRHHLLSIDARLASLQTDQKVAIKAAVDLSLAPKTDGKDGFY